LQNLDKQIEEFDNIPNSTTVNGQSVKQAAINTQKKQELEKKRKELIQQKWRLRNILGDKAYY